MEKIIPKLLLIIFSLLPSLLFTLVVGYIALEILPCYWFGSGFEGSCGYGAVGAATVIAVVAGGAAFVYLVCRILRD